MRFTRLPPTGPPYHCWSNSREFELWRKTVKEDYNCSGAQQLPMALHKKSVLDKFPCEIKLLMQADIIPKRLTVPEMKVHIYMIFRFQYFPHPNH